MRGFIVEAVPIMIIAIPVINILNMVGIFQAIANFTAPVISGLLGLPKDAIAAIFVAFFRMDAAMALLAPLGLSAKQLVVSSVVSGDVLPLHRHPGHHVQGDGLSGTCLNPWAS